MFINSKQATTKNLMQGLVTQRFIKCHDFLKENYHFKSSRQFALMLDYAPQSLNDILKGKREVTVELCRKAICKFGLNSEYLFCGNGSILREGSDHKDQQAILTIVTDQEDNERIVHVPIAAQAGYGGNITDVTYFKNLPSFSLPDRRFQTGTHRCFDIAGDSMEPSLFAGDQVVCSYIEPENWAKSIKDQYVYVVVTHSDVVIKRLENKINDMSCIVLISDNDYYDRYKLDVEDIVEIWMVRSRISAFMPSRSNARSTVNKELDILRETLDSQSALIQGLNGTINAMLKQNRVRV